MRDLSHCDRFVQRRHHICAGTIAITGDFDVFQKTMGGCEIVSRIVRKSMIVGLITQICKDADIPLREALSKETEHKEEHKEEKGEHKRSDQDASDCRETNHI